MQKLSLEALKVKAEAIASEELIVSEKLLETISGGIQDDCHGGNPIGDFFNVYVK